jgi:uncharacterized protein
MTMNVGDPVAAAAVDAIHRGDAAGLSALLAAHPGLADARLVTAGPGAGVRSLLHVATDWPGHYPHVAATIRALVDAGADVHARFGGRHSETPLHWAASSDDVDALDALLDAGADIDARGAVIADGTPLDDAVAFGQWRAAHRLVERGAAVGLFNAAALGLLDHVQRHVADGVSAEAVTRALWAACHGGQATTAEYLLRRGGDLDWVATWEEMTPLDAARRAGDDDLVTWLVEQGAKSAAELRSV